ncbi:MAG: hypothetical protein WCQ99_01965 [Pseudomonadota bacterium]
MAQGLLAFKYEEEKMIPGMTALAGLPVYLELAEKIGLDELICLLGRVLNHALELIVRLT